VLAMLVSMIVGKASIITVLSKAFGVPTSNAIQAGLLNAQGDSWHGTAWHGMASRGLAAGGEFAFVAFGIAERMHLLSLEHTKLLVTTVALSMALTPWLEELGTKVAAQLESRQGPSPPLHPSLLSLTVSVSVQD
jgi:Kef-type K+ transport system membrane component KefB